MNNFRFSLLWGETLFGAITAAFGMVFFLKLFNDDSYPFSIWMALLLLYFIIQTLAGLALTVRAVKEMVKEGIV